MSFLISVCIWGAFSVIGGIYDFMMRGETRKLLGKERYKQLRAWQEEQGKLTWYNPLRYLLLIVMYPITGIAALVYPSLIRVPWWLGSAQWPDATSEEQRGMLEKLPERFR